MKTTWNEYKIYGNPKTKKEARRRINTLYNERNHHSSIIRKFIKKIKKNTEILINHIEEPNIPATNNIVENYYRTTLPRKHKRIYRTLEGLKRRIKLEQLIWTHKNSTKRRLHTKQQHNLQTKQTNNNHTNTNKRHTTLHPKLTKKKKITTSPPKIIKTILNNPNKLHTTLHAKKHKLILQQT